LLPKLLVDDCPTVSAQP
jgi:hypothetical protein